MRQPKVSIIMGVYNCQETVEESIESILRQTYETGSSSYVMMHQQMAPMKSAALYHT